MPRKDADLIVIIKHPACGWWVRLDLPYTLNRNTYQVKVSSSERGGYRLNSTTTPEATATEIGRQVGRMLGKRWGKLPTNRRH